MKRVGKPYPIISELIEILKKATRMKMQLSNLELNSHTICQLEDEGLKAAENLNSVYGRIINFNEYLIEAFKHQTGL